MHRQGARSGRSKWPFPESDPPKAPRARSSTALSWGALSFLSPTVRVYKKERALWAQGLQGPMARFVVYVLCGITTLFTTTRRYVGLVELEEGEGADEAVERRRQQHASLAGKRGALFLRICHSIEIVWV
jgi:hypothetical protein